MPKRKQYLKKVKISKKAKNVYIGLVAALAIFYIGNSYLATLDNAEYAKKVEAIYKKSQTIWTVDSLIDENGIYLDKDKDFYNKMKTEAEISLRELGTLRASKDAWRLRKLVNEYFLTSKKIAQNSLKVIDYTEKIEKIEKDLGLAVSTPADPLGDMEKWRTMIGEDLKILKNTKPGRAFKDNHSDMLKILEGLYEKMDEMIKALESRDGERIKKANEEFKNINIDVREPLSKAILEDIISEAGLKRYKEVDKELKEKIKTLSKSQNLSFV